MVNFNWLFLVEEHCNSRLFVLLYDEAFFKKNNFTESYPLDH